MNDKAKSWGPMVFTAAVAAAQFFMSHTLQSLDSRVGRIEGVLMVSPAAASAPAAAAAAALPPTIIVNGGPQ